MPDSVTFQSHKGKIKIKLKSVIIPDSVMFQFQIGKEKKIKFIRNWIISYLYIQVNKKLLENKKVQQKLF